MIAKHHHNKTFFSEPTIASCYWAGFLAADGCIRRSDSVSLRLSNKERYHIEAFKNVVEYSGPIIEAPKTNSCGVTVYAAQQWHYDLENNFNVVPNKSLTLKPPHGLIGWGDEFEKAFVVGYIDGDGCIRYDNRDGILQLDVFSGSGRLVRWAKERLETWFGLPDKRIFKAANGRSYLYRLLGKQAEYVREELRGVYQFQLARKWNVVKPSNLPKRVRCKKATPHWLSEST